MFFLSEIKFLYLCILLSYLPSDKLEECVFAFPRDPPLRSLTIPPDPHVTIYFPTMQKADFFPSWLTPVCECPNTSQKLQANWTYGKDHLTVT